MSPRLIDTALIKCSKRALDHQCHF